MNNKKSTKRTLVSSILSLVLCMAMLIGTTFAWFTDDATSAVNTIQSGSLKIALEYYDGTEWVDADGKILDFVKATGAENEAILWEPGCTYQLPKIRVRNDGKLALKYELVINGVNGDAKLLEAIDFTANGAALKTFTGELLAEEGKDISEEIVIQGHMREEAGNEYQDLKVEGISISVFATQLAHEYDSFDNQYDADAVHADYFATPETVQDIIYAAKAGEVIGLTKGTYGALKVSTENGKAKDDITLVAAGDAVVDSLSLYGSSNVTVEGLTFVSTGAQTVVSPKGEGKDYVANILDSSTDNRAGVSNLVIKNCTFTQTVASRSNAQYVPIDLEEQGRSGTRAHNITIDNCVFACDAFNYIRLNYLAEGSATITNNTFGGVEYATVHNTINATGNGSNWVITGNTFFNWNIEKAAFGSSKQGNNKNTLTIQNNNFVNTTDEDKVAVLNIKVSYTAENSVLNYSENIANYGLYELNSVAVANGNDNLYYMTVKGNEKVVTISDADALKAAVKNGNYTILKNDVEAEAGQGGYSHAGLAPAAGTTIDGNGNSLNVENANNTWDCAIYTQGGTIKNLEIGGAFRGIFTAGCSSDIIIDNCVIDNVCYTISSDGANPNYSIIVTNTTLNGWTSYASGYKSVSFTDCKFGKGTGGYQYAFCRPYSETTFTNCVFEEGYEFDASRTTNTFVNCYVGDTLITADNIVELLGTDAASVVVK